MRTLHHPAQIYYPDTRHVFIHVEVSESFAGLDAAHSRLAGLWQVAVPSDAEDVDAGWTALGAFHTVFDTVNPCALDICVYDASMQTIELD
jgi:hypothetical protein